MFKLNFFLQLLIAQLSWSDVRGAEQTKSYDFVVVGSGIGGSTLAVELSKKNYSVLLIELGPKYKSPIVSTPLFYQKASTDPNITLNYAVDFYAEKKDTDLNRYGYSRVGGLGGCSIHNVMVSMLPNTEDFNLMVEMTGDNSWNEKVVREKYFKPMEKNDSPDLVNRKEHGFEGWFPVAYQNLSRNFKLDSKLKQVETIFMPNKFVDINGYNKDHVLNTDFEGNVLMPAAIDNIKYNRFDIVKHIEQHQKKYKLDVWTDTLVTKVLLDNNNKAVGINYSKGKYIYNPSPKFNKDNLNNIINGTIRIKKEVILSAGAFNSPQLLMLSGIGPKAELEKFDIPVKVDLPGVGKNLMDKHVILLLTTYKDQFSIFANCTFKGDLTDPCYTEYIQHRRGPYTSNFNIAGELIKSKSDLPNPDLFVASILDSSLNFPKPDATFQSTFTSVFFKAKPKNFGSLHLQSDSPYQQLKIEFNKFSDTNQLTDLHILMDAIRRRSIKLNKLTNATVHLPLNFEKDDTVLEQYIRNSMAGFHVCCTNKIGKKGDPSAVVDGKFQVRNTDNLRVVDASVFLKPPGYFPALFTHLIALKVADIIDQDHKV